MLLWLACFFKNVALAKGTAHPMLEFTYNTNAIYIVVSFPNGHPIYIELAEGCFLNVTVARGLFFKTAALAQGLAHPILEFTYKRMQCT